MAVARRQVSQQLLFLSRSLNALSSLPGCRPGAAPAVTQQSRSTLPLPSQPWARFQSTTASVQQLLDSISATQLRDALASEAELRPFMTHEEFLQFIMTQKAADNEEDAEERAEVLAKAGVVLRFNGMVYLQPQEVSELVYRLLPTDRLAAERHLAAVERELAEMDKQHKQLRWHAQRWPRRWLVLGCTALAAQLFGFAYLTWWELSWDVMEPVAYFVSLTYSLIAYMYFLYTRGSYFEQKDFKEYWEQQLLEKRMAAAGFDLDKYEHLMRTRDRYKRYMASKQLPAGGTPAGDAAAAAAGAAANGKMKDS